MKLIIGIGNPDKEYQNTRHNVGFMLLDYMTKKSDLGDFKLDKKSDSLIVKGRLGKSSVVLAKPQNYVNKSGEAVSKLIKNLKLKI